VKKEKKTKKSTTGRKLADEATNRCKGANDLSKDLRQGGVDKPTPSNMCRETGAVGGKKDKAVPRGVSPQNSKKKQK